MPRVIITRTAALDIQRCRRFLAEKNPLAAERAARAILKAIRPLGETPEMGRLLAGAPNIRELIIRIGKTGYAALYEIIFEQDEVQVLAVRHLKEAGYGSI